MLKQYREAITLLEQRQLPAAADRLRDLLQANPDMTDVWVQYAQVLTRLGRQPEALEAYKRVVRLKPEEPNGLLGAASALLALGRFDEARALAELAIAHAPSTAHQALASIALAKGDYPEAQKQADLAAQADPTLPMPIYVRGMTAYGEHRYAEALPLLEQARDKWAARTMQPADLRFYIGDTLARLERYPDAERAFKEELGLYPNSMRAHSGLAMLYATTNRPDDVEKVIADLLRVSPSPAAYKRRSYVQAGGRPRSVRAEAREVRALAMSKGKHFDPINRLPAKSASATKDARAPPARLSRPWSPESLLSSHAFAHRRQLVVDCARKPFALMARGSAHPAGLIDTLRADVLGSYGGAR